MKKLITLFFVLGLFGPLAYAQLCSTQSGKIDFYSKTPAEDIEAHSGKVLAVMSTEKKEMAFSVENTTFEFPNKLMQEHFNEKYMESEKYPKSSFKGKVNENIDLSKDGEYPVTVTGKLNLHGVEKDRTIGGTISVNSGVLTLKSEFKVLVKDHDITIPKLVIANIAEEITVTVNAQLMPKK
jgi:hypothetical protein